jgi:methyl-accepting chemotaxis protein
VTAAYPPTGRVVTAIGDPSRRGSPRSQLAVGLCAFALAFTLVAGQLTLAITKGIHANLKQGVAQVEQGNEGLEKIIDNAEPTAMINELVKTQSETLVHTSETMTILNGELAAIAESTGSIESDVNAMQKSSAAVSAAVGEMSADTAKMYELLLPIPKRADSTARSIDRIATDTAAVSGEMKSISGKLERYGLPQAKGVRRR